MKKPGAFDSILEKIPGIISFKWFGFETLRGSPKLRLHTKNGAAELRAEQYSSHLSAATVDRIVAMDMPPDLVLAPAIAGGTARAFIQAGIAYIDLRGNCHIDVPGYLMHIEGKTQPPEATGFVATDASLRRPGYQVLFAYLARPELLDATVRTAAAAAGVSRKPVSTLRRRLVEDKFLIETKSRTQWRAARHLEALNLWLGGYKTVVRPSLMQGSYRTREEDPLKLERELEDGLADRDYAWGGAAAAYRQTQYYRGQTTVIHGELGTALQDIQARPARQSANLYVLGYIGAIRGDTPHLAHPLLVYSELYQDPSERAREAAQVYYDKFLGEIGA